MKNNSLRIKDYLGHILKAIERIYNYTEDVDEISFLKDEMLQDAVIRNIEIIGEAARNIQRKYPAYATEHSEIPWDDIYLMRNRVSHGYFTVDLEIVWRTIETDLPELYQEIETLYKQF